MRPGVGRARLRALVSSCVRVTAVAVAVVLAASSVEAVVAPRPVSAAPAAVKRDPREVPVLRTPSGPDREFAPARPVGDFRPLMGANAGGVHADSRFDEKTSSEVGRSEKSVEYTNTDGTRSVVLSQVPMSVRDEQGVWRPVDTRLGEDAGSKKAKTARHGLRPEFAERADDAALLRVNQGGTPVSISLRGARPAPRKIKDSTATYADVLPDTDVQYVVEPGAVKESIIVKKASAAGAGGWVFRMDLGGLTPSLADDGVVITDGTGGVVAALPPIQAWDSSGSDKDHKAPAQTGGAYALARDGNAWLLTVSIDQAWLRDSARVFPVVVDPTYTYGFNNDAESLSYKSDGYSCRNCGIQVGNSRSGPAGNPNTFWRTADRFDYTPLFGKTVVGARLDFWRNVQTGSMLSWPTNLFQATSPLGINAIGAFLASAPVGDRGSMQSQALTDFIAGRVAAGDNYAWMMVTGAETNDWSYKNMQVNLIVDYGSAPPAASLVGPADDSVLTSLTPTLTVSAPPNPSGDGTLYCFKVATGADGLSGIVVDSGCVTSPSWTVPAGVLQDGTRYTWRVLTAISGGVTTTTPSWVGHFKVDQRIGDPGPSPVDHVGPVTVNLANGNTHVQDAGPTFHTVGGTAGVTFSYNSQQVEPYGLRASYFNDPTHTGTPDANPVLVRNEPQVNSDWGSDSPFAPALAQDWFVGRWEGYFQVPATGTYHFGGIHANGAKIWVSNQLVYNNPNTSDVNFALTSQNGPVTEIALTAGQRVPIKAELYHSSGPGRMKLWAETNETAPTTKAVPPQVVPSSWLFTSELPSLSLGWTMSANLDGSGTAYAKAHVQDQSVVLTDATGTKHTWTKKSTGGYTSPAGEDGILAVDTNGKVTMTEGATVYVFNVDGTLATQSSSVDSRKPAALQNIYSGTPSRLTQIKDPVSGRSHTLYYNTDNSNKCYGGATAPPSTDPTAPPQMLCRITYWDGSETRLWYSGQTVGRIENPGSELQDYGYSSTTGPLTAHRSSLAADWVAAAGGRDTLTTVYTTVTQDTSTGKPKATNVTLPAPDAGTSTPRPAHSYRYDPLNRQSFVDVAGLTPTIGFSRKVTYDDADRALVTTDASGATVQAEWNVKDQATASVDAAGRRSTTVYDYADRPVDHYGPAPASCFNGQLPTPACASTVPHSHTNYDEGLVGLSSAYYDNVALAGAPKVYATGVGTPDGSLSKDWGASPPVANTSGWSGRFTGEIQFPAAGIYGVGFNVVDGVRLWIDDVLVIDSWTDKPTNTSVSGSYNNTTAGAWHRVRVEYYNRNGTSGLVNFTWSPPGGAWQGVPGQYLHPRYGLATSSNTDDTSGGVTERAPSTRGASSYSDATAGIDAVFGLKVSSTADPGRLNLIARTGYEQPGTGYLRKLTSALPAGDVANAAKRDTTTYYGDTETRANPCDATSVAVNQAGAVKTDAGPVPAAGGAVTTESVYDATGRVVAIRIGLEDWSCNTHDARDRPTKVTYSAFGGQPARTVTFDYAVGGDPLTTKMTDENGSITTVHDLLGQTVSYTDASATVTTSTYDQAGRLKTNSSTVRGVSSALSYTWDDTSRLTDVTLDGRSVATPTYTAAGELQNVAYANGSRLDAIGRNDSGLTTSLTWKVAGSTVVDTVTRSRNNRVTDDTVTDNAAVAASYSYTYDTVGRLIAATVPHHQLTYGFDATGGCGPNTAAGLNTNRTALTDSLNGAAAVTTTYCYDDADRLLSTSGATALSFTYDAHGDAVGIGGDTLGYDATKRHISTTTAAATSISYTRDVDNRLIARTVTGASKPSDNGTTRYAYSSDHDSADLILDAAGNLTQRLLPLPGGVLLTKNYDPNLTTNWAYPNLHGDILFTADGTATRTGGIYLYDPYGQNIDPVSGAFADIPIASTAKGGLDYGWLGQHERPIEHLAGQQAIEMGARTYLPILGRFLQVDPVAGGAANDYDYVHADPINSFDLMGTASWGGFFRSALKVVTVVATVTSFIPGPIGTVSSFVLAGAHAIQGDYAAAAMDLLGAIPGGRLATHLAEQGFKAAPKIQKAASCAVGNSFTPETPVVMADGTTKAIKDVAVGDQVQATDPSTGQIRAEPVEDVIVGHGTKHLIDIGIESNVSNVLTATANHPIWVEGTGWVDAGDLKIGDPIRGPPGLSTRIAWVRDRGDVSEQSVYNLTVASIHTYRVVLAGVDLLVHNGCRTSGVYVLHFANGEKYVGRSVHIERRVQQHRKNPRLSNFTHHQVVKTFPAGTSRHRMRLWEQAHIAKANRAAGGVRGGLNGLRNRRNEIRRRR